MNTKSPEDKVYSFIRRHRGKDFVVHCDAGISRSVAVAAWMRDRMGYCARFTSCGTDHFQNRLVYQMLQKVYEAHLERCRSLV